MVMHAILNGQKPGIITLGFIEKVSIESGFFNQRVKVKRLHLCEKAPDGTLVILDPKGIRIGLTFWEYLWGQKASFDLGKAGTWQVSANSLNSFFKRIGEKDPGAENLAVLFPLILGMSIKESAEGFWKKRALSSRQDELNKVKILDQKIEAERKKKSASSEKRRLLLTSFRNPSKNRLRQVNQKLKARRVLWFESQKL